MDVCVLKAGEATEISWDLWRLEQGTYTVPAVCFLFQMLALVLFVCFGNKVLLCSPGWPETQCY